MGFAIESEGFFYNVKIRMVFDCGPGKALYIAYYASDAEWFDPSDEGASYDGWVRNFDEGDIEGEIELFFADEKQRLRGLKQLEAWEKSPPPHLTGVSSLQHHYVGLIDPDTRVGVGVKTSASK